MVKIVLIQTETQHNVTLEKLTDVPDMTIVGKVTTGTAALQFFNGLSADYPDLTLIDYQLPDMAGTALATQLLQQHSNLNILILMPPLDESATIDVQGYLPYHQHQHEFLTALRSAHLNHHQIHAANTPIRNSLQFSTAGFSTLTHREHQILQMLLNGYSIQAIAEEIEMSPKAVNSYRGRIYVKLNVNNDRELLLVTLQQGGIIKKAEVVD